MNKSCLLLSLMFGFVGSACSEGSRTIAVFADEGDRVAVAEQRWESRQVCIGYEACTDKDHSVKTRLSIGHFEEDLVVLDEDLGDVDFGELYAFGSLALVDSADYLMLARVSGDQLVIMHFDGRVES